MSPVEFLDYTKADIKIHVDTHWERMWRSRSAAKEPETTDWINEHVQEGDVFWDVGANVGTYGLMAASRGARVVMFEPEKANLARIHENIALNPWDIRVLGVAVSDSNRTTTMSVASAQAGGANNYVENTVPTQYRGLVAKARFESTEQEVECRTLNTLSESLGQPDHIKMDVDGHELYAVRGGVETLQACKTVMVEITHGEGKLAEIQDVFKDKFHEEAWLRSYEDYNHLFVR